MMTDDGPRSPDGYMENTPHNQRYPGYIGGRPDQEAVDALLKIREEAFGAGENVSYALAGDALKHLGVTL